MIRLRNTVRKSAYRLIPPGLVQHIIPPARRLYNYLERIMLYGTKDLPTSVGIETNSICTRSCYYCPREDGRTSELEEEAFRSVIDQLKEWGFKGRIAPYSFNEPLTDNRIFDLLIYAREKLPDCRIDLGTNGDLLTSEKTERLIEIGVGKITLTMHEPTSADIENRLNQLNQRYGIIELVDLRDGHRKRQLSNRGGTVDIGPTKPIKRCHYVDNIMVIRADGEVVLCCLDYWGPHKFGNIHNERVQDIWNNPEFKRLRRDISRGIYELEMCQKCGYEMLKT